jgi:hypothetical protein
MFLQAISKGLRANLIETVIKPPTDQADPITHAKMLFEEDPRVAMQRQQLARKSESLQKGLEALRRFERGM